MEERAEVSLLEIKKRKARIVRSGEGRRRRSTCYLTPNLSYDFRREEEEQEGAKKMHGMGKTK